MAEGPLPRGTVAFLFTDIEGSTRLWRDHPEAMRAAYARHDAILRGAIAAGRGVAYKTVGDALQAAFPSSPAATTAAVAAQRALAAEGWEVLGLPEPLGVRMALHAGAVEPDEDGDYRSPVLNRLGRLLAAGHGGQILLSEAAMALARGQLPAGIFPWDLGPHRFKDLLEAERVHQLVVPELENDFPPLRTLDARPHNLPPQPTPFLGREGEVARVVELLRSPEVRLLTLTGPGGTGKTRLGLQAAAELADDFADGVFFVPLAPLDDPALVPAAIAAAVGVREGGGQTLADALREELTGKALLLLLDNVEQVVAAAPFVGDLLAACPALKVLATSRVPLRLRAERELPVPPLGLPRRKPPPTLAQMSQFEAVRLFAERARAVKPDFAIDNESAPAVAEICHRLDGLPLAIELAAARVRLLPPRTMLARLEQRLSLLTGGARDLPERQRTLRAAIAWSDDLLTPDERALFRRLSVFAGGWTLEAAEAVAGSAGSGELGLDVLDGLERLAEHSILRQQEGAGGEPRFRMLETIREYGLDQLDATSEAAEARARHAAFFLVLAEQAEPQLTGPQQGAWLDRLEAEHDNVRAALGWALEGEPSTAARFGAALWRFWAARGHLEEGRRWLERVLVSVEGSPSIARAEATLGAGVLGRERGDLNAAEGRLEEALALARAAGSAKVAGIALNGLANIAADRSDVRRAAQLYEEALALHREAGNFAGVATVTGNLGILATDDGQLDQAAAFFEEALALTRRVGNTGNTAVILLNFANLSLTRGTQDRAAAMAEEALALGRGVGERWAVAAALNLLGDVAAARGDLDRAAVLCEEALGLAGEVGEPVGVSQVLLSLGDLARRQGEHARAVRLLEEALAISREVGVPLNVASSLGSLAAVAREREDLDRAAALLAEAIRVLRALSNPLSTAEALGETGLLAAAAEQWGATARLLAAEAALRQTLGASRPPSRKAEHERAEVDARVALGEAAFGAAWAAGAALSADEALAEAAALVAESAAAESAG